MIMSYHIGTLHVVKILVIAKLVVFEKNGLKQSTYRHYQKVKYHKF